MNRTNQNAVGLNSAKTWQLVCFALLQGAANTFLMAMNFSQYVASGMYGVATVTVGVILMGTRMFDAVTDPICGFILDHVNTKWGRFRPLIVVGYLIMALATLIMFNLGKGGVIMFTILYLVYIIGYTIVTSICKAAIPVLTNDPKQRPTIGRWSAFCTLTLSTIISVYFSSYLIPKYGGFTPETFRELSVTAVVLAGIASIAAVAALVDKDKPEIISTLARNAQPKLRDCWEAIKGNHSLQMLIVAASTDKLALQISGNSTVSVMMFGILIANYSFSGPMRLYAYIPSLIGIILITKFARKAGSRDMLLKFTWAGILISVLGILFMIVIDPTQISAAIVPTAIFVVLEIAKSSVVQANASLTNVMIADCADYEMSRTGKFMPGMVSTVFSFVDKFVSSFATAIVGFIVAAIGFKDVLPQVTDQATPAIFVVTLLLYYGLPLMGWIASVISLKFYELTPEKMQEVRAKNAEIRAKNAQV